MSLGSVKEEPGWCVSDAAARAGLYVDHEVKNELVLGPVLLQRPDMAYKFNGPPLPPVVVKQEPEAEPCTTDITNLTTHIWRHVKVEPEWETSIWKEKKIQMRADWNVKEELLESQQEDSFKPNVLHPKLQIIKQEAQKNLEAGTLTHQNTAVEENSLQSDKDNKVLLKQQIIKLVNCDANKKISSNMTKPDQVLRSRLRIRYEEDSDSDLLREKTKVKSKKRKVKSKKPKKIHRCQYCGKQFSFRPGLTNHIRIHTGEKPYSCEVCSKKFSDYAVLIRHRRVHSGEKPHVCDVCGNKYSEKYLLKNHKRVHTGEKTYFCKDCPKTFINSSNFRRHQKVHTHKYSCDICKKQFENKSKLVSHIVNHMKPKPYVCDYCNKGFGQSGHLHRHMAVHKETKEVYACGVCKKEFTQHGSLKKHVTRRVCERKKQLLNNC